MHHIHLAEGMRLRFPARSADFDQGVEIGIVAALVVTLVLLVRDYRNRR